MNNSSSSNTDSFHLSYQDLRDLEKESKILFEKYL